MNARISRIINRLTGGAPGVSLSAESERRRREGSLIGKWSVEVINWWTKDPRHCEDAFWLQMACGFPPAGQPSLGHTVAALAFQWGVFFLVGWAVTGDTWLLAVTGAFASGFYLGRELEQLWPHAGRRSIPDLDPEDWQRFIRQGLWPSLACAVSVILHGVLA